MRSPFRDAPMYPFASLSSPFGGTGYPSYTLNGLKLSMVADFKRDRFLFDSLAKYTVNGLTLSMVSDFSADIHASEV